MKKTIKIITIFLALTLILASCTWPLGSTPVPASQGTPNATLTALFDTSNIIPATITPPAIATSIPVLPTVDIVTKTLTATPEATTTSTLEPTATSTSEPTATSTTAVTAAPSQRANAQLVAVYLSTAPVQDGTYAEWVDKTNKYTAPYFAWGRTNWANHADSEASFAVAWDNTNLYIGVKVTDDIYSQNFSGDQMYMGDSIEILIDTNLLGDFYTTSYTSDDYHLGISAGNPSSGIAAGAYLYNPTSVKGPRTQVVISTQFESATIYRIEAAIPWSMIGVTPTNGMRLGFAFCVDDNDNVTDYDHVTMLSSASGLYVFNPTTFGELVLIR